MANVSLKMYFCSHIIVFICVLAGLLRKLMTVTFDICFCRIITNVSRQECIERQASYIGYISSIMDIKYKYLRRSTNYETVSVVYQRRIYRQW